MKLLLIAVIELLIVVSAGSAVVSAQQDDDLAVDIDPDDTIYEYRPNPGRVRIKSTLPQSSIDRFLLSEPIVVNVDAGNGIVSSLLIEKTECYKPEPIEFRPRASLIGSDLVLAISPQILERLDYQPVRLILYQSNLRRIVLASSYDPADAATAPNRQSITPQFFVRLRPQNGVAVNFKLQDSFRLTNDIMDRAFPLNEIRGIFFAEDQTSHASIVLNNGDTVTGRHHWPERVEFSTPWGDETVELDKIESITRDRSVRLMPSGIDNPKFVIVQETPE